MGNKGLKGNKDTIKRISKQIKFPAELVDQVTDYQLKNNISSFSGAVYELLRIGLKNEK